MTGFKIRQPLAIVVLLFVSVAVNASAATRDRAFSRTRLSLSVTANRAAGTFRDFWHPKSGVRLEAEMPFYLGNTYFGVHMFRNSRRQSTTPGFWSSFFYLGWSGEWRFHESVSVSAGGHAGMFLMDFSEHPFGDLRKSESELGIGSSTTLRFWPDAAVSFDVTAEYRIIYTNRQIKYANLGVGVSRSFDTPRWLRGFLR